MKGLFTNEVRLVGKVMSMELKRQNVITGNMANVHTPGYKPRELAFEKELQAALGLDMTGRVARTDKQHIPAVFDPESFGPEWEKAFKPRIIHGEDRVNIDKEVTKMAKNSLHYNALTQVIKANFDGIKNTITEGSR
ncbi:MAG: flagellar basal body rod protein FlgB [Desulfovibrionaceae bacterium]|nr:flagellar basal body rod protein FlgB [Desulfovibrionaceae bacterium]